MMICQNYIFEKMICVYINTAYKQIIYIYKKNTTFT